MYSRRRHLLHIACGLSLIGAVTVSCAARQQAAPPGRSLAIIGVTIIDVAATAESAAHRNAQTVIVQDARITRVGAAADVQVPPDAQRLDGRGRFLIPGLWDAHTHLSTGGSTVLAVYVANGVTTVRDLGGPAGEAQRWQAEMDAGTLVGPRLFRAGPIVEGAWWLDRAMKLFSDPATREAFLASRYRLASAADAPSAIAALQALGADVIKFRNLRADEFRALAVEASARGIALAGHPPPGVSLAEAAESGMRTLEHADIVTARLGAADDSERRRQFARIAAAGAAITPTLVANVGSYQTPASRIRAAIDDAAGSLDPRRGALTPTLVEAWRLSLATQPAEPSKQAAELWRRQIGDIRLAHESGVPLLTGTDLGVPLVYPGFAVADELSLLVSEVGLSPLQALQTATIIPARVMGVVDQSGRISAGHRADLVLLDADPLQDIRHVARIAAVVVNGRIFDRPALDTFLRGAEGRLPEPGSRNQALPIPAR